MNRSAASALATQLITGALLLAAALASGPAHAAPISYGAAMANPDFTIDFSGLAENTYVGATYASQGVTFGGVYSTNYFGQGLTGTTAPAVVDYTNGNPSTTFPITITFATPVSTAQFYLYTDGYGMTITSLLAGIPVETVVAGTYKNNGMDYFGFSNSRFDQITLNVSQTGAAVLDNLQVTAAGAATTPVDEPGSAVLLLAGLAGLCAVQVRRGARTATETAS